MNLIWIGTIVNTHSLKGEVRVLTNSEIEDRYQPGQKVYYLDSNNEYQELEVISSRIHKSFVLLKFSQYENINEVLFLKNKKLFANKLASSQEELYYEDLLGFLVYENEVLLGKVESYFDQKAYHSLEVVNDDNLRINIPILDDIVTKIDFDKKRIIISFLKGNYEWR